MKKAIVGVLVVVLLTSGLLVGSWSTGKILGTQKRKVKR